MNGLILACAIALGAGDPYGDAYREAVAKARPLAVYVNVPPAQIQGYVTVQVSSFPGFQGPGVVVAVPDGVGGLSVVGEYYGPTSPSVVIQAGRPRGVVRGSAPGVRICVGGRCR